MDISNPRKVAREEIQKSIPAALWQQNGQFCATLREMIAAHRIMSHPIIAQLETGTHDLDAQRYFHLEFRHAFAQIFTDALIQAMATTAQIEPVAGARGKVASRFLLQLNVLDELGFLPQASDSGDYAGNPELSHYVQFDLTLRQLGLTPEIVAGFRPSQAARDCRATFESHYDDHVALSAVMAVSETVFCKFSGPWAKSVGSSTNIDVQQGYHSIHVEHDGAFIDDDHSEDAWYVFRQAITPANYTEISKKVESWLATWAAFLDELSGAKRSEPAAAIA